MSKAERFVLGAFGGISGTVIGTLAVGGRVDFGTVVAGVACALIVFEIRLIVSEIRRWFE